MKTVPSRLVVCARLRPALFLLALLAAAPLATAATQRQMGYLSLEQSSAVQWHKIYFKTAFTVAPIVIAGPPSYYDTAPTTVRVRNVTTISFEIQVAEWDYLDGVHPVEDVSWIALEPGTHTLGTQKWVAGRQTGVTATAATVAYGSTFTVVPVVLAQVQTAVPANPITISNPEGLTARVGAVATANFQVRLAAQQSLAPPLDGQTINWVAMDAGTGTIDGLSYVVATSTAVTNAWKSINLGAGREVAAFLASSQTYNDADPFAIRTRKTVATGTTVEIFLEEEKSSDTEVTHASENVGYLAVAKVPDEITAGLEFTTVTVDQTSPTLWQTVALDPGYTTPVVVFGPVQSANGEPIGVRVRAVTATSFQFQLDEWDYQDGIHPPEKVSFVVLEQGTHYIAGRRWIAGRRTGVTHTGIGVNFARAFDTTPVLLTQVATNTELAAVSERLSAVSTASFNVRLAEQESDSSGHLGETVHYIAAEPGVSRMAASHFLMQSVLTANDVTSGNRTVSYTKRLALPHVLGDVQTLNDPEPIVPRITNVYESVLSVRAQEETSLDTEVVHGVETFGVVSAASVLDSDEDGMPDTWETTYGLNPNDATDAALDGDNDGQNNLTEQRYGTNPTVADTAGTLTIVADIPNGYERSDTGAPVGARVRINRTGGVLPATINFTLSGVALPGTDYVTKTTGGTVLTGTVSLGFNSTAAFVVLEPIADAVAEYPEAATVTIAPNSTTATSGRYTLGATIAATPKINDATDTPMQEQIFVALLTPTTGSGSSGSGLGTMVLNGPKTQARVSLSFNGLRGPQTNAYLRYGGDAAVGQELRANLGNGSLTNVIWNIPDPAYTVYSGQQIIDALFQLGGKWIYTNIGTTIVPNGEIAGKWRAQSGSITFVPPDPAPPITALTGAALERDVARFLTQATFGPTKAEITALATSVTTTYAGNRINAFNAWIDTQLGATVDQTKLYDFAWAADQQEWALRGVDINTATYDAANTPSYHNRRRGWWTISLQAHDQLRQRAAFALSEILVTSGAEGTVNSYHYGHASYHDLLASHVTGNFRTLLEDVSKHPIMGQYLSSLRNQKAIMGPGPDNILGTADDVILVSPDENYAREIMQLFSIGLVHRHLDGSLKLDATSGAIVPTYSNLDITNLARVFTGWAFSKNNGNNGSTGPRAGVIDNTNFFANSTSRFHQAAWMHPMKNFDVAPADYHDKGAKTVLGSPIAAGGSGQADLTAALDILHGHPNVAPFISRLLIQRLVTSNPSAGYVYRVAQKFENNGSGVRGDLKAVFKQILLDYEARTLSVAADTRYGKQKEPILRYVQMLRALGAKSNMPLSALLNPTLAVEYRYPAAQYNNFPTGTTLYRYPLTNTSLGQTPLNAPTVFNWFLPDYSPAGPLAAAGLVAPEMQLATETSVVSAINLHQQISRVLAGQGVDALFGATDATLDDVFIAIAPLTDIYNNTSGTTAAKVTAVLDHLDVVLMGGDLKARYPAVTVPANPRNIIIDTVVAMTGATINPPIASSDQLMRELLYLVVTSPACLHQK